MKNKFMTKALAVVLSASMALSLSSATALTANAAAAPKLNKKTVTVKAGKKAKVKLKAASYKAGWRITKATVKKAAKAKAKVKKNKKVVVVSGVSKGATKVVLKLKNAKTGASKKLKFKAKVTAEEVVVEPTVEADATLTAAKQTTFDTVVLTFDKEVDATKVSLETVAINGSVGAATTVTIGEDKKTVSVVYGYAENTEYTFTIATAANIAGSATVKTGSYVVTDVDIKDQSVETGTDQEIKYALVAGDVDVTKYNNYTDYVTFDFEGDFTSYSADPTKPTINFSDRDKTATVKVTFNNGVDAEITKTVKITSVAATATTAEARFAGALKKWYLVDDNSTSFSISPDGNPAKVVFYAKNKDGKAVKYDDIEVISSNENVATVSWSQEANGKYYTLTVDPAGNAGTAKMTIKTTEYKGTEEVKNEFSFDVNSKEFNNNIYNVEVGSTSVSLYNSPYAPSQEVVLKPVNSLGQKVSADFDITVTKGKDDTDEVTAKMNKDGDKIIINALGATAGTYKVTVVVTGEAGNNTKEITKNINVRVTDAISGVYPGGWKKDSNGVICVSGDVADGFAATYKVEVADLKLTDISGKKLDTEVKLAVYVSSKPVGYLYNYGVKGYDKAYELGQRAIAKTITANKYTDINLYGVKAFVYSGSNYYDDVKNGVLYLGQAAKTEYITKDKSESSNTISVGEKVSIFESSNTAGAAFEYYGDGSSKNECAKAGSYNVVVKYHANTADGVKFENGKQLGNTGKFNVSYQLTMPKLEYNTSEQAENKVVADVDLVRADDGTSVTWCANDGKSQIKYPNYTFSNSNLAKGDKIYAVCVEDTRGGDNSDENWPNGGQKVKFIIEKTTKITA